MWIRSISLVLGTTSVGSELLPAALTTPLKVVLQPLCRFTHQLNYSQWLPELAPRQPGCCRALNRREGTMSWFLISVHQFVITTSRQFTEFTEGGAIFLLMMSYWGLGFLLVVETGSLYSSNIRVERAAREWNPICLKSSKPCQWLWLRMK